MIEGLWIEMTSDKLKGLFGKLCYTIGTVGLVLVFIAIILLARLH